MVTETTHFHKEHRRRVKERFLQSSVSAFADHEMLELLLFYAIPQKDTNVLAHALLDRFGSLGGVLSATHEELCEVDGVGEHVAVLLRLILPLAARTEILKEKKNHDALETVEAVGEYMVRRFAGENSETVQLLLLDNARSPIACVRVHEGVINSVSVTPRMLIETALARRASFAVLAHNHPGGLAIPSGDDLATTRTMQDAFSAVGIPLLEHIVVAGSSYTPILYSIHKNLAADTSPMRFSAEYMLKRREEL